MLSKTRSVQNGRILVIGSENPWVEATLLAVGASSVVTLEYGKIVSDHPAISTLTPDEFRTLFLAGKLGEFDAVVTFHDTGFHKPSPEPFKKILERLDISAEECIMVGDWPERDVVGARKVGMKTAFAKYGDTFGTRDSGADYDLDNIFQLIEIVKIENNL